MNNYFYDLNLFFQNMWSRHQDYFKNRDYLNDEEQKRLFELQLKAGDILREIQTVLRSKTLKQRREALLDRENPFLQSSMPTQ